MISQKKKYEVIIQAGGVGSRLRHFTWNKPKCLVSYDGKPVLYHLFDVLEGSNFHIIADYQINKIKKYFLISPPKNKYKIYRTKDKGTCAGIKNVLKNIETNREIIIIWSDLIIRNIPPLKKSPTIFTTSSFMCRWSIQNKKIQEKPSFKKGIPGIFYFKNKKKLQKIPFSGEFVKWYSKNIKTFHELESNNLKELGDFSTLENSYNQIGYGRYFNKINISNKFVEKKSIDSNFHHLIKKEQKWYSEVSKLGFNDVPKIFSEYPYKMEKVNGKHVFEIKQLDKNKIEKILENLFLSLETLHNKAEIISNKNDIENVYISKTLNRLKSVSKIIPNYSTAETFTINGVKCKNYLHKKNINVFNKIKNLLHSEKFTPVHGDPTFSNIIIKKNLKPIFIDPRGYFSNEASIYGDPLYDYSKIYYSLVGNYDSFNRRKFKLYINNLSIEIMMDNIYPDGSKYIFESNLKYKIKEIKLIHALIWLSLSGYVKDDIDSILASFYNGLYWMNKALD